MPLFWLCAAITAVAAMALSLFARTQRSHRGFGWWIGALWLNAVGAATIGAPGWVDVVAASGATPALGVAIVRPGQPNGRIWACWRCCCWPPC